MNILIVDDEGPARQRLGALIGEIGAPYRVVGEAANGREAVQACQAGGVDLVLMDIRMPEMDGIDAALRLAPMTSPPAVIFVTAYEEHALQAFESNAVGYLLKPIRRGRLQQALERVGTLTRPQLQMLQRLAEASSDEYLSASYRGGIQRIALDQVIYFQADQKYVTVCHTDGEALLEESLRSLEQRFGDRLLRIHRNALVVRQRLAGLEKMADGRTLACMQGTDRRLEVSRRHLPMVRRWLRKGG
jgi:two-component system response regulator AlgR